MTQRGPQTQDLFPPLEADEAAVSRLHGRLVARAQKSGLLDIAYRTLHTPIGQLLLATTEKGLVRVAYDRENHDQVLRRIAEEISPRILEAPGRLDAVSRQIDEYFLGRRRRFDLQLDFRLVHGFRRIVLRHLRRIDYGTTASYASIAAAAGSPRAVRAVGTACATNPLPLIVPCHRVVRSDGTPGQYVGGVEAKKALLTMEAASS